MAFFDRIKRGAQQLVGGGLSRLGGALQDLTGAGTGGASIGGAVQNLGFDILPRSRDTRTLAERQRAGEVTFSAPGGSSQLTTRGGSSTNELPFGPNRGQARFGSTQTGPSGGRVDTGFSVRNAITPRFGGQQSTTQLDPRITQQNPSGVEQLSGTGGSRTRGLPSSEFASRFGRVDSFTDPETGQTFQPTQGFQGFQGQESQSFEGLGGSGDGFFFGTGAPGAGGSGGSIFRGFQSAGNILGIPTAQAAGDDEERTRTITRDQQNQPGFFSRLLESIIPGRSFNVQPNTNAPSPLLTSQVPQGFQAPQQPLVLAPNGRPSVTTGSGLAGQVFTGAAQAQQPSFSVGGVPQNLSVQDTIASSRDLVSRISQQIADGTLTDAGTALQQLSGAAEALKQAKLQAQDTPEEPILPPPPEVEAQMSLPDMQAYENVQRQLGLPEERKELEEVRAEIDAIEETFRAASEEIRENPELPARLAARRIGEIERQLGLRTQTLANREGRLVDSVNQKQQMADRQFNIQRDNFLQEQAQRNREQDDVRQQLQLLINSGGIASLGDAALQQWAAASGIPVGSLKSIQQQVATDTSLDRQNTQSLIQSRGDDVETISPFTDRQQATLQTAGLDTELATLISQALLQGGRQFAENAIAQARSLGEDIPANALDRFDRAIGINSFINQPNTGVSISPEAIQRAAQAAGL